MRLESEIFLRTSCSFLVDMSWQLCVVVLLTNVLLAPWQRGVPAGKVWKNVSGQLRS